MTRDELKAVYDRRIAAKELHDKLLLDSHTFDGSIAFLNDKHV